MKPAVQQPQNSQFLLYQDDNGVTSVNVRFDGSDVWLAQQQIAQLFDTTQQNVSQHINAIIEEGELPKEATHKNFLLVRQQSPASPCHAARVHARPPPSPVPYPVLWRRFTAAKKCSNTKATSTAPSKN